MRTGTFKVSPSFTGMICCVLNTKCSLEEVCLVDKTYSWVWRSVWLILKVLWQIIAQQITWPDFVPSVQNIFMSSELKFTLWTLKSFWKWIQFLNLNTLKEERKESLKLCPLYEMGQTSLCLLQVPKEGVMWTDMLVYVIQSLGSNNYLLFFSVLIHSLKLNRGFFSWLAFLWKPQCWILIDSSRQHVHFAAGVRLL